MSEAVEQQKPITVRVQDYLRGALMVKEYIPHECEPPEDFVRFHVMVQAVFNTPTGPIQRSFLAPVEDATTLDEAFEMAQGAANKAGEIERQKMVEEMKRQQNQIARVPGAALDSKGNLVGPSGQKLKV